MVCMWAINDNQKTLLYLLHFGTYNYTCSVLVSKSHIFKRSTISTRPACTWISCTSNILKQNKTLHALIWFSTWVWIVEWAIQWRQMQTATHNQTLQRDRLTCLSLRNWYLYWIMCLLQKSVKNTLRRLRRWDTKQHSSM